LTFPYENLPAPRATPALALLDGCVTLKASRAIPATDIRRVVLRVNPLVLELTGRKAPATTSEAKRSVYHSTAAAILREK
jgi:2-methylcitrate dehydratase PrpD